MPLKDVLAALIVISAWGVNFVIMKVGLTEIPPFLLGALRFSLVAFPAVFFIKRPALPWTTVLWYGLTISLGQFAFLFTALNVGMPAGLASLVLQAQAFFTVLLAAIVWREGIQRHNVLGLAIAVIGLIFIGLGAKVGTVPALGFALTLLAALCWATGNLILKSAGKADMVSLVVWGALVPPLPFLALSLLLEGPQAIQHSLANISYVGISVVVYLAFVATLVGYVLWGGLLSRHPVSKVAPLSLLVPVIGLLSAAWFLDEHLAIIQWLGAVAVMLGLAINVFGRRLLTRVLALR